MFPRWSRTTPSRLARRVLLPGVVLPVSRLFMDLRIEGREHLRGLQGPVLIAANHQSHMDTAAIYSALPAALRDRVAPAMAREFFAAWFGMTPAPWPLRLANGAAYYFAVQCFNAFPLVQRGPATRHSLRYLEELVKDGHSILIYPEGKRTDDGRFEQFRRGAGMIALSLQLPVVPVRLDGLYEVLPKDRLWPTRGPVRVAIGPPLAPDAADSTEMIQRIERAIQALGPG